MSPEEFRTAAHALVDWVADYRLRVPELPVQSTVRPGEVRAGLPASAPETPQPLSDLIQALDEALAVAMPDLDPVAGLLWMVPE